MLSFDITDKTIKIVKGTENGEKISITDAVTIDLTDDTKEIGRITDISEMAIKINEALKIKNMREKKAIVSISSNQTIFKELTIPKVKGSQFMKMVKSEMQAQLAIDDTYSISYVIVDELKENDVKDKSKAKGKTNFVKILATACPYEIIDNCKMLFSKLSISLKSVMIGCNCISKIILSDMKLCMRMPLLAVQLDNNFLSINLYDDLKLAFSRFTDIDPGDYGYATDYISQAVGENIFRMLQFQKTRGTEQSIENVVFYGDLSNIDAIMESMEQMELNATVLNIPPQLRSSENIDFSSYANAIGALFKRNKETDKINLLETDTRRKTSSGGEGASSVVMLVVLGGAMVAVAGSWFILNTKYNSLDDELSSVQYKIEAAQDKKDLFERLTVQEEKINDYRNAMINASDAFKTHPAISFEYFWIIESEMINAANELYLWAKIKNFTYSGYNITLDIETAATGEPSQDLPALIVKKLLAHKEFDNVLYTGYSISGGMVSYNIQIPLSPIEPTTEPEIVPTAEPTSEMQSEAETTEADGQN